MVYTRRNVWELGGDWADPILWYARGVKAMKARALDEGTAWRFYGAIHGINDGLWEQLGYLSQDDQFPSDDVIRTYWNQCQHGSWYFLPWHRGYLMAFEAIIRAAVTGLGGPDDWALPYWNYFKPDQYELPPAFASADWPDGQGDNPLFVTQRYGPNSDGNVYVPVDMINLDALADPDFTGSANGGSTGFGGVDTGFEHGGPVHGGIETQPHDWVHGLVGGGDDQTGLPGLMSDPDTAGLDPIFWLHHCNIDRLWEVWRQNPTSHVDPTDPNWVDGPPAIGEAEFILPMPGDTSWTYTPGEMSDLSQLGYDYDDVSPPTGVPQPRQRLERLGVAPEAAEAIGRSAAMAPGKSVELLGANAAPVRLVGSEAQSAVDIEPSVQERVTRSLSSPESISPDRIFLNLENVRGLDDSAAFSVYINVPEGESPSDHPERLAGSIAPFGVRKATRADAEHAGEGLTFVLEITRLVDELHLNDELGSGQLDVKLVPVKPVPASAELSIGRISIFRQGD